MLVDRLLHVHKLPVLIADLHAYSSQKTVTSILDYPITSITVYTNLHYAFGRHWFGQRQLIAVTCIAEHA